MSEYVPFGDEWKAEVMRLKKSEIIDMLAKALRENASRPTQDAQDGAKRALTGRNGKPTNVLADGTVLSIAPPVI